MNAELSAQIAIGATVFPSERRGDPSGDHRADSTGGYAQVGSPDASSSRDSNGHMADAQRAANVMSPVGQQYPEQIDWSVAAAARARAVPPWLLALLFVGALGVALALTIVIAKLIR